MPYKEVRYRRNMRSQFYRLYREKAQAYVPTEIKIPPKSTMFARVNKIRAIKEAARKKVKIVFTYLKIDNPEGSAEYYEVSPLSFKYRRLKKGVRKVLYAYDEEKLPHQKIRKSRTPKKYKGKRAKGTIKNFLVVNIENVFVTDKPIPSFVRSMGITIR